MVLNGWEKTTFGEHIDLLNGFAFKSALYSDDENDIKLLRGDNIEPNKLRWRDVKRWSKTEYESLEKYHLKENDFIIAMDRTWITAGLKVAEVKQEDLPCLLVQRVSRIRSLPTLCQDLIKHHFSSYQFEQYVKSVQTETAVPHISATQIREFGLLLPPLPEQQKIAKILSTWDNAISMTERLIDNSKQQKKALMQQLLTGKKRLLDENGKRFEGDWGKETLKILGEVFIGLVTTMTKSYVDDGIPLIRNSDIKPNHITKEKMLSLCEEFANKHENRKLREGDVVTVHTGEVGVSAVIDRELDGCIGFATLNTRPYIKKLNPHFLSWYFNSEYFINWCVSMSTGDGRQNLNLKDFVKAEIPLPSLNEQKKIVSVLTNADKEIELLEQQLADLQQEKKALMQMLLTGKVRVVVDGES